MYTLSIELFPTYLTLNDWKNLETFEVTKIYRLKHLFNEQSFDCFVPCHITFKIKI